MKKLLLTGLMIFDFVAISCEKESKIFHPYLEFLKKEDEIFNSEIKQWRKNVSPFNYMDSSNFFYFNVALASVLGTLFRIGDLQGRIDFNRSNMPSCFEINSYSPREYFKIKSDSKYLLNNSVKPIEIEARSFLNHIKRCRKK